MQSSLGHSSAVTLLSVIVMGVILGDVLFKLGGDIPALPRLTVPARPHLDEQFDARIDTLFASSVAQERAVPGGDSPFYTLHFQPPKKPAPPKKAKTKTHKIVYQGVFTSSNDQDKAFLLIDDTFKSVRIGNIVISDLKLKRLDGKKIEIGNDDGPTATIRFRETSTVEIPE